MGTHHRDMQELCEKCGERPATSFGSHRWVSSDGAERHWTTALCRRCAEAATVAEAALRAWEWPPERLQALEQAFISQLRGEAARLEAMGDLTALQAAAEHFAAMAEEGLRLPDDLRTFVTRHRSAAT